MTTEVITKSKCDLCGFVDERPGAHGSVPPVLWSRVVITKRLNGAGWSESRVRVWEICRRCAEKVEYAIDNMPAEASR